MSKKYLGIDFGSKNVGVAISDDRASIVFPKKILKNDKMLLVNIFSLIKEENITDVVIGQSVNQSGVPNSIEKDTDIFIGNLKRGCNVEIHRQKEDFTSVEAFKLGKGKQDFAHSVLHSRQKKDKSKLDALSATIILERYLSGISNNK